MRPSRRPRPAIALSMERLEDRLAPAVWTGDVYDLTPGVPRWTNAEVQEVSNFVNVPNGQTLSIQPGTIVKFDAGATLYVHGTLVAGGPTGGTVVFTSVKDDTGGDTNGDGSGSSPAAGAWTGIQLESDSAGNTMNHVEVRYAGGLFGNPAVYARGGAPLTLTNGSVHDNRQEAVFLEGKAGTTTVNTVTDTRFYRNPNGAAVRFNLTSAPILHNLLYTDVAGTAAGNKVNGALVQIGGDPLPAGVTDWNTPDVPYQLEGGVNVPAGSTLVLHAGMVIKGTGTDFFVHGTLKSLGTSSQKVLFTSPKDDAADALGDTNGDGSATTPAVRDWGGIEFDAESTGNVLDHVEARYAGGLFGGAPVVYARGGPVTLTNSSVHDNDGPAVQLEGAATDVVTDDRFYRNAGAAVQLDVNALATLHNFTYADPLGGAAFSNRVNGAQVFGTFPTGATRDWNNPDVPYQLSSGVNVPATSTLNIHAGMVIKNASFYVDGTLTAVGTDTARVLFTSAKDDAPDALGDTNGDGAATGPAAGDWSQIQLRSGSTGNVLDHVEVRYAGGNGAVQAVNAPVTVTHSAVHDNLIAGVRCDVDPANASGVPFVVTDDAIYANAGEAVVMNPLAVPTIHNLSFFDAQGRGNHVNGVVVFSGSIPAGQTREWNSPDIPFSLDNYGIDVLAGGTLTIDAGQVIKGGFFSVSGTLRTLGTDAAPVIQTVIQDDLLNDTNGDGTATTPVPGGGSGGIEVRAGGVCVLDHFEDRYLGSSGGSRQVTVRGGTLTVSHSLFRDSASTELDLLSGSTGTITDTTIIDNQNDDYPIKFEVDNNVTFRGVTLDTHRRAALVTTGSGTTLPDRDVTWADADVPYLLQDTLTVRPGRTLTLGPGKIVKTVLGLSVRGTLVARGTADRPVILTNPDDDTAGGDATGNGTTAPGSIAGVEFLAGSTGSVLDHVELRRTRGVTGALLGGVEVTGADVVIRDSLIEGADHDTVVASTGANLTMLGDVVVGHREAVQALGGSTLTMVNCTVDDNVIGLDVSSPTVTVRNSLFTNSRSVGVQVNGTPGLTFQNNDVFHAPTPGATNYANFTPDATNLSVDPRYVNAARGQYQLRPGSPAEDAGTSATGTAPPTDFFGNPRFDDPNVPDGPDGSGFDLGAFETQQAAFSEVDLLADDVTGPAAAANGATVTVNWTVRNAGTGPAAGPWSDAVYLSDSPVWTPRATFLGRVAHAADLAPGQSYAASADVTVRGLQPGNNYFIVRANDLNDVFEGQATANNAAASPAPVTAPITTLTPDVAFAGTFAGVGQYFQVTAAAARSLLLTLHSAATSGATELYVRRGQLPSRTEYDFAATDLTPDQDVVVPGGGPGTYYVLAYPAFGAAAFGGFTLLAQVFDLGLSGATPASGGNAGRVTAAIRGAGFSPATTVTLSSGATVIPAASVQFGDPGVVYATFDLTGRPAGAYDLNVTDAGQTVTQSGGFAVTAGSPGHLSVEFNVPGAVRAGHEGVLTVDYANDGGADLPAPILSVAADNASLAFPGETSFVGSSVEFLAINPNGPAGVLPPGAHGSAQVRFLATNTVTRANFTLSGQGPGADSAPLNWAAAKDNLRPADEPADAWDAIYANFTADVGTTLGDFQALLDRNATYLSSLGESTGDESRLMSLEFQQAGAFGAISQRYTLGAFGRGVPDPTALSASADTAGNVTVHAGGQVRVFVLQGSTYRGVPGDTGQLTRPGGTFRLQEADGGVTVFRADGRLDYSEDADGNRVTAGYTGTQLTSFTDSFGDVTTLRYNAQGRIDQITDPVGRVTSFGYDASGEHLTSVTDPAGTTSFTYVTGQGPQREHAVASVTFPDGTHTFFDYDARGRLSRTTADGGANPVTDTYDGFGGATATDALGHAATTRVNEFGDVAFARDALGNVSRFFYDGARNLVRTVGPDGSTSTTTPDGRGNPVSGTDPLGRRVDASYDPVFNQLQTIRDPRGFALSFRTDARGNALSTTFPDGTSDSATYDAHGNMTDTHDRLGQATHFTYDAKNLLTREDFADGTSATFTYDAHRNLKTATNAAGTTTYDYDTADRVQKVTYPDGRFLSFTYDAGGRRKTSTDQGGFTVTYNYDPLGRLQSLTNGGSPVVTYTYDAVGRLARKDLGNGTATTYAYFDNGEVKTITNLAPGGAVQSRLDYTYDPNGRVATMTTAAGVTTYGYDPTGQLTSVSLPGGRTITYAYDAAGNRTTVADSAAGTTGYTTNNLNEYTAAGGATLQYDVAGNLIARTAGGVTTRYGYDALGRLASVTSPTDTFTYTYDALGTRIAATHNGSRTNFLTDPAGLGDVAAEYDAAGALVAHYTYGADGLVSRVGSAGASYYGYDVVGNTTQLTGPTGAVTNTYTYLPFGEVASSAGTAANPFTFGGQLGVRDDGTGLSFMRNRSYDAGLGRFTQADPTGLGGGDLNLYRYAGNQPTGFVDPSGLDRTPSTPEFLIKDIGLRRLGIDELEALYRSLPPGPDRDAVERERIRKRLEEVNHKIAAQRADDALKAAYDEAERTERLRKEKRNAIARQIAQNKLSEAEADRAADDYKQFYRDSIETSYHKNYFFPDTAEYGDRAKEVQRMFNTFLHNRGVFNLTDLPEEARYNLELDFKEDYAVLLRPQDPNDIAGPQGVGTGHFVGTGQTFPYTVLFENQPTATAPALVVKVVQQLDADLDWTTFELGDFGFGPYTVSVPAGRRTYSTRIDASATRGLFVDASADFDPSTGRVTWTFSSVDPATGLIPAAATAGFLPPDDAAGSGEGFVTYRVRPKAALATGTAIDAKATVFFDAGLPDQSSLDTPQFRNTIDVTPPTSVVTALPATTTSPFTVSWGGSDGAGSGVAAFDVFVSDNGGPFTAFRTATTATSASFTGTVGHTYSFYTVATDNLGLVQPTPASAQASTAVVPPTVPPPPPPPPHGGPTPQFAVGSGAGSVVRFFNPDGSERFAVDAFPGFAGGARTAVGDFDGDGTADVAAGTGPGGPSLIRVLSGADGHELASFAPFEPAFLGGVFVAAGDVTADGKAELVVTPDEGGGPRVTIYRGGDFMVVANFFGIDDPNFRGGARAGVGDMTGDGYAEVVVSAGFQGGPRVSTYDGKSLAAGTPHNLFGDFFIFEPELRNGAYIAVGDVDGDGFGDIIGGAGPGGGPRVRVLSGRDLLNPAVGPASAGQLANFFGGDINNRGGIRVTVKNLDGDTKADIVVGDAAGTQVTAYRGKDFAGGNAPEALSFDAFPGLTGGVFVG